VTVEFNRGTVPVRGGLLICVALLILSRSGKCIVSSAPNVTNPQELQVTNLRASAVKGLVSLLDCMQVKTAANAIRCKWGECFPGEY